MNLNIYLPPNSAHPSDVIKSIIFGCVRAYFLHNTNEEHFKEECVTLAQNLIKCGWKWNLLYPLFANAHRYLSERGRLNLLSTAGLTRREREACTASLRILVFKLPFHPRGVQRNNIREAYIKSGLAKLIPNRRFICAQTRAKNLRDRVCNTSLKNIPGANPSDYLAANP